MVQIIQGGLKQANPLGQSLGQGLGMLLQNQDAQRANIQQQGLLSKALSGQLSPQEASGLSQENQMGVAKYQQQQQQQQQNLQAKQQEAQVKLMEKVQPLLGGREVLQRMRDIGANNRLGRGSGIKSMLGGETAKDTAEYSQLGKSLISLATNIPIRNRVEFETLAEKLYNPSLPDKTREGILDAMERIIDNSLSQYVGPQNVGNFGQDSPQGSQNENKERPPLESFYKK